MWKFKNNKNSLLNIKMLKLFLFLNNCIKMKSNRLIILTFVCILSLTLASKILNWYMKSYLIENRNTKLRNTESNSNYQEVTPKCKNKCQFFYKLNFSDG
jgi:hypothetical protein